MAITSVAPIENKMIAVLYFVYTQYDTAIILFSIGATEVIAI